MPAPTIITDTRSINFVKPNKLKTDNEFGKDLIDSVNEYRKTNSVEEYRKNLILDEQRKISDREEEKRKSEYDKAFTADTLRTSNELLNKYKQNIKNGAYKDDVEAKNHLSQILDQTAKVLKQSNPTMANEFSKQLGNTEGIYKSLLDSKNVERVGSLIDQIIINHGQHMTVDGATKVLNKMKIDNFYLPDGSGSYKISKKASEQYKNLDLPQQMTKEEYESFKRQLMNKASNNLVKELTQNHQKYQKEKDRENALTQNQKFFEINSKIMKYTSLIENGKIDETNREEVLKNIDKRIKEINKLDFVHNDIRNKALKELSKIRDYIVTQTPVVDYKKKAEEVTAKTKKISDKKISEALLTKRNQIVKEKSNQTQKENNIKNYKTIAKRNLTDEIEKIVKKQESKNKKITIDKNGNYIIEVKNTELGSFFGDDSYKVKLREKDVFDILTHNKNSVWYDNFSVLQGKKKQAMETLLKDNNFKKIYEEYQNKINKIEQEETKIKKGENYNNIKLAHVFAHTLKFKNKNDFNNAGIDVEFGGKHNDYIKSIKIDGVEIKIKNDAQLEALNKALNNNMSITYNNKKYSIKKAVNRINEIDKKINLAKKNMSILGSTNGINLLSISTLKKEKENLQNKIRQELKYTISDALSGTNVANLRTVKKELSESNKAVASYVKNVIKSKGTNYNMNLEAENIKKINNQVTGLAINSPSYVIENFNKNIDIVDKHIDEIDKNLKENKNNSLYAKELSAKKRRLEKLKETLTSSVKVAEIANMFDVKKDNEEGLLLAIPKDNRKLANILVTADNTNQSLNKIKRLIVENKDVANAFKGILQRKFQTLSSTGENIRIKNDGKFASKIKNIRKKIIKKIIEDKEINKTNNEAELKTYIIDLFSNLQIGAK